MKESFFKTAMLLGEDAEAKLGEAKVMVFGVGGVGGHAADALARCGIGSIAIVDAASVKPSNLNRQLCAEKATIGMPKVEAMKRRIEAVSDCAVAAVSAFVTKANICELITPDISVIIDAVDTVSAKLCIIERARELDIPVLSSMGAGNRLDPTMVRVSDIYSTSIDPLSRVMRHELRKRGIPSLRVVYSLEEPKKPLIPTPDPDMKPNAPASVPFVPAAFGLALAHEAVRLILSPRKEVNTQ